MSNQSFGPAYDQEKDGERITGQLETIRQYMLRTEHWYTLTEIEKDLGYPQASISADLRHLRKEAHGFYDVQKRRRDGAGLWEYRVMPPILEPGLLPF